MMYTNQRKKFWLFQICPRQVYNCMIVIFLEFSVFGFFSVFLSWRIPSLIIGLSGCKGKAWGGLLNGESMTATFLQQIMMCPNRRHNVNMLPETRLIEVIWFAWDLWSPFATLLVPPLGRSITTQSGVSQAVFVKIVNEILFWQCADHQF